MFRLLDKARAPFEKYNVDMVVANRLDERYEKVYVLRGNESVCDFSIGIEEDQTKTINRLDRDHIEEAIVSELMQEYDNFFQN